MGYAILNWLNMTLKMIFFQENFNFHNFSWVLDQWRQKKTDLIEGRQQLNWYPGTSFYVFGYFYTVVFKVNGIYLLGRLYGTNLPGWKISIHNVIFTNSANWANSVVELPCPSVCVWFCAIGCSFFRPLMGREVTWLVSGPMAQYGSKARLFDILYDFF